MGSIILVRIIRVIRTYITNTYNELWRKVSNYPRKRFISVCNDEIRMYSNLFKVV